MEEENNKSLKLDLTDKQHDLEVKRRLRKLVMLLDTLKKEKFVNRNYLLRLFLFQPSQAENDLQMASLRDVNAYWKRGDEKQGNLRKFVFPYSFKVESYFDLLSDKVNRMEWFLSKYLRHFSLEDNEITDRAQRFSSLIFTSWYLYILIPTAINALLTPLLGLIYTSWIRIIVSLIYR